MPFDLDLGGDVGAMTAGAASDALSTDTASAEGRFFGEHVRLSGFVGPAMVSGDDVGFGGCYCMSCARSGKVQGFKTETVVLNQDGGNSVPQALNDDIPDDVSSTVTISVGQSFTSAITGVNDLDFIRITLEAGKTYTVSMTADLANGGIVDALLELRNLSGLKLSEDDDSGIFRDAFLLVTPETTTTFFLVAKGWDPNLTGTYTIRVEELTTGNTSPTFFADNGKTQFSWDQAAIQITRDGGGWNTAFGVGTTVTYAYRESAATMPTDTQGFAQMSEAQIIAFEAAFAAWSDVANITFVRVGSGTSGPQAYSNNATILVGGYSSGQEGAAAFAYLPNYPDRAFDQLDGDIWVNVSQSANATPTVGGYGPQTFLHEIGHAIGLRHPGTYNASGEDSVTYTNNAQYLQDSRMFSVMSYFGSGNTEGNLGFFSAMPQMHDIAAAQRIYGPNMTTRTGDTVYGFNSNANMPQYALASSTSFAVFAIWDAGGVDTIDLSGYATDSTIDLREEAFSSAGPSSSGGAARYNIGIARGAVIENAIGGAGADTLTGNAVGNVLEGRQGQDSLNGGGGDDTLNGGAGADVLNGGDGLDMASYATNFGGIVVSLASPSLNTFDAQGDTFNSIEGIIGSEFGDELTGNAVANRFVGGAGNDTISGGAGVDTAAFSSASTGATWRRNPDGSWSVTTSSAGTDTLRQTEFLEFSDRDVFLDRANRTFSGDGTSNVLFRRTDGIIASWEVNGTSITSAAFLPSAGSEWVIRGSGDFDGDGKDDVLWQRNDGLVYTWKMDGGSVAGANAITGVGSEWTLLGVGDFNGDLKDDIAWRRNDGTVFTWHMDGATIASAQAITGLGNEWTFVGTGDFNSDGKDDFVWRRADNGQTVIWQMNGGAIQQAAQTSQAISTDWAIAGIGDVNGDGRDDFILRRASDGMVGVATMSGSTVLAITNIAAVSIAEWSIQGIGDYNGDGRDDILWRNLSNNIIYVWTLNGATIEGAGGLSGVGTEWGII